MNSQDPAIYKDGVRYLPVKIAAKNVGLVPDYVSRMCREKTVRAVRHAGIWHVDPESLSEFLQKQAREYEEFKRRKSQIAKSELRERELTKKKQLVSSSLVVAGVIATFVLGGFLVSPVTSGSRQQFAAAASGNFIDAIGSAVFHTFCPFFHDCGSSGLASAPVTPTKTVAVATTPQPAPQPQPQPIARVAPPPPASQPLQQIVQNITNPIRERIIEKVVPSTNVGFTGVTLQQLDSLEARMNVRFDSLKSAAVTQSPENVAAGGSTIIYTNNPVAQNINKLDGVTITNATIIGGSITGTVGIGNTSSGIDFGQSFEVQGGYISPTTTLTALFPGGFIAAASSSVNDLSVSGAFTLGSGTGLLEANAGTVSTLTNGSNGQVLKILGGVPTWGTDNTGSGAGNSAWATTTDSLAIYTTDPTQTVLIGNNATTTGGNILEVKGNSLFRGTLVVYNGLTASRFTATSSVASLFPYASTTGITTTNASTTNLTISSVPGALLKTDASGNVTSAIAGTDYIAANASTFSTTSTDYWQTQRNFFSTTSANYWSSGLTFFSTTSADYFALQRNFFSTTSADYLASQRSYFSTTSTDYYKSQNNFFSTSSADYLATQRTFFSTSSSNYLLSTYDKGFFFSTTSADYWKLANNFFSTTSANYWSSNVSFFSTTSADYLASQRSFFSTSSASFFADASTTIPKTYSANTFTGLQTFNSASTTALSATNASTTNLVISSLNTQAGQCLTINSIGAVTAQSCNSGGFAYLFPNNATTTQLGFNGGFTAYASSTIGDGTRSGGLTVSGGATTTGNAYFAGNVGIGTTTPGTALDVFGGTTGGARISRSDASIVASIERTGSTQGFLRFGFNSGLTQLQSRSTIAFLTGATGDIGGSISGTGIMALTNNTGVTIGSGYVGNGTSVVTGPINGLIVQGNTGIGSSTPGAKFGIHANAGDTNALLFSVGSSTASATSSLFSISNTGVVTGLDQSFNNSTSTSLAITNLATQAGQCLTIASNGAVTTQSCTTGSFAYLFPGNATTTSLFFNASTTIGNGTATGGLTINGTATTTNLIFTGLSSTLLKVNGQGQVAAAVAGTDYASFGYLFPSNATTTQIAFNGGLTFSSATGTNLAITGSSTLNSLNLTNALGVGFGGTGTSSVTGANSNLYFLYPNASAVARTNLSKMAETLSIKDFGAVGDGVTDDTAAINAALSAGANKSVYMPAGTYLVTGVTLPSNIYVFGDGTSTVLRLANGSNTYVVKNSTRSNGIHLEQFAIDGNKANQTSGSSSRGVYLVNASYALIKNLYIHDTEDHGIHLSNNGTQTGNIIESNQIENAGLDGGSVGGSGIAITSGLGDIISHNVILNSYRVGIRPNGYGITVTGNTMSGNGEGGVVFSTVNNGSNNMTVTGNTIYNNKNPGDADPTQSSGIRLTAVHTFTVTGNTIYGNGGSGIDVLNGASNGVISSNTCFDNAQSGTGSGIRVFSTGSAPHNIQITGNICYDSQSPRTQQYGLSIENNAYAVSYSSNMFYNNLTSDLNITASGSGITGDNTMATDTISWFTGGSEQARLTSTGFGIGTTSPNTSLVVQKTNGATFGISNGTQLDTMNINSGGALTFNNSGGNSYSFQQAGTARVTIATGGNLGIGTTSPYGLLTVATPNNSTGANANLFIIASSTSNSTTTLFSVSNTGVASTTNLVISSLNSQAGQCLTISATGAVTTQSCATGGFGYLFPSNATTTLLNFNGGLTFTAATGTSLSLAQLNVSASSTIGDGTRTGGLTINGGATTTGTAYFAASVGVATQNPSSQFTIKSNGTGVGTGLRIENDANTNRIANIYEISSGEGDLSLFSGTNETVKFRGNGISYINTGSTFGIGTTSPWGKLAISLNNNETAANNYALVIASSTQSATTTLFSISNTGVVAGLDQSFNNSTTTSLAITNLSTQAGQCLTISSTGAVTTQSCTTGGFTYLFPSNATTTLLNFNGGLTAYASSTIGNGTATGGLTINGGATTTGNAYFGGLLGIGTTSPFTSLSVAGNGFFTGTLIGNISSSSATTQGTPTSRALAERFADTINVKDYGAKCDGVTDDAAAINSAITAASSSIALGKGVRIVFPQGNCLVTSTINLTNMRSQSMVIEGSGAIITGRTSGTPVIDALGARWLRVRDLTIVGSSLNPPNIGMQIGKTSTSQVADLHNFDNVSFSGYFTFTSFYNIAGETTNFTKVDFRNSYASESAYNLVEDGLNHWNITSAFTTVSVPVDTPMSFNENVFTTVEFLRNNGGPNIWMANTSRHTFIGSYIGNTDGVHAVVLYQPDILKGYTAGTSTNEFPDFGVHVETSSLGDIFYITGGDPNPVINGLRYSDFLPSATSSVFAADSSVATTTLNDIDLQIEHILSTTEILDTPTRYVVSGNIYVGRSSAYNVSDFTGQLNIAGTVTHRDRALHVGNSSDTSSYTDITDVSTTQFAINKTTSAGSPTIDFNPIASDGTSGATVRYFRTTNTSGGGGLQIYKGDGTASLSSLFRSNGDSYVNALTGRFGVGTTSPFARLSVQANNGDTYRTLFAIGSSTQTATTTLFSISNTGSTTIANGLNITAGCFAQNGTCLSLTDTIGNWFAAGNTFGTTTAATTSSIWTQGVFFSSSTVASSVFPYASSTAFTTGNAFISGTLAVGTSSVNSPITIQNTTSSLTGTTPVFELNSSGSQFLTFGRITGTNSGVINAPTQNLILQAAGRNVGIGSTTPTAQLSLFAPSGNTTKILFDIGSSTSAFATSTLFSISNTGLITGLDYSLANGTTTNLNVSSYASVGGLRLNALVCSGSTQLLQTDSSGNLICGADDTSSGAAGIFSTTTDSLAIYSTDVSRVLLLGTNATSTTGNIFEASGNALFRNNLVAYGNVSAPFFTATSTTQTSSFAGGLTAYASSTIGNGTAAGGLTVNGTATTSLVNNGATSTSLIVANFGSATNTAAQMIFTTLSSTTNSAATTTSAITSVLTQATFQQIGGAKADLLFSTLRSGALTEAARITSTGNFGIGTTDIGPTAASAKTENTWLHVGSANGALIAGPASGGFVSGIANRALFGQNMSLDVFGNFKSVEGGAYAGIEGTSGVLNFYTNSSGAQWNNVTPSPRMTILTSGNIGIGTTTPGSALSIQGNQFIAGNIVSTSSLASVLPFSSSTASTIGNLFFTNGTFTNATGTSLALTQLNVFASSTIGSGTATGGLTINGGATSTGSAYVEGNLTVGGRGAGSSQQVMVDVGVAGINDSLLLRNTSGGDGRGSAIRFETNPGIGIARIASTRGADDTEGRLLFYTRAGESSATEKMRIDVNGYVGIGTTSPYSRLTVFGRAGDVNLFEVVNSASTTALRVSASGFGTTTLSGLSISGSATSTSNVGFNITAGCYAVNGTCLSFTDTIGNWFAAGNTFSTTTAATTTSIWTQGVFFSSSTRAASQLPYASTTAVSAGIGYFIGGSTGAVGSSTTFNFDFAGATSSSINLGTNNLAMGQMTMANATTSVGYNFAAGFQALMGSSSVTNSYSYNAAIGYQALKSNTTGNYNNALGYQTLYSNLSGSNNNALGQSALYANTSGTDNNAMGQYALQLNTSGTNNQAIGGYALNNNFSGGYNIGIGYSALTTVDFGSNNIGIGKFAGAAISRGYGNIMIGEDTNLSQGSGNIWKGNNNIGLGNNPFFENANGDNQLSIGNILYGQIPATTTNFRLPTSGTIGIGTSTPFGKFAISLNNGDTSFYNNAFTIASSTGSATTTLFSVSNTGVVNLNVDTATSTYVSIGGQQFINVSSANSNIGVGLSALTKVTGAGNSAFGPGALQNSGNAYYNAAFGTNALQSNTTGLGNSAFGYEALQAVTGANGNTAFGNLAGLSTIGEYNTIIGHQAGRNLYDGSNNILIGDSVDVSNLIHGSRNIGIGSNIFFQDGSVSGNNQLNIGSILFGTLPATSSGFMLPTSGTLGIGTGTPFGKFAISLNNGDTSFYNKAFIIASSTGSATTTLFSVSNTGSTTASNGFNITAGCYSLNGVCIGNGAPGATGATGQGGGQLLAVYSSSTPGSNVKVQLTGAVDSQPSFANGVLTLPSNTSHFVIEVWGGGGGGGNSEGGTAGSTGGSSSFGSGGVSVATTTASGGGAGGAGATDGSNIGGPGGTASGGDVNLTGGPGGGGGGSAASGGNSFPGGVGGSAPSGGGGGYSAFAGSAGGSAFGGGGSGGGTNNRSAASYSAGGGGGGGYAKKLITSPSGSYYYNIGAGGAAGTGGVSAGSAGGAGGLVITVYSSGVTQGAISGGAAGYLPYYSSDTSSTTLSATSSVFLSAAGNFGIGSTTPWAKLSVSGTSGQTSPLFSVASSSGTSYFSIASTGFGTTTLSGLTINGSATSTSNVGFNITAGCYAVNGTCLSTGGGGVGNWFAAGNTFGTTSAATSSSLWTQGVFFSSSTVAASQFPYASSTALTAGNLFSTNATTTNLAITGITNSILGTDAFGNVIASTSLTLNNFTVNNNVTFNGKTTLSIASSSQLSVFNNAWFGATATSTFTSAGLLGIGSSTPFGALTVQATNGNVYPGNLVFNIASTTSGNNTPINLFSITNTGNVLIGDNIATSTLIASTTGQFAVLLSTSTMKQLSSIALTNFLSDVYVQGRYAYTVSENANFSIVDVSNPGSPKLMASVTSGLDTPEGVHVQGKYAYVVSQNNNKMFVYDVSNPTAPVQVAVTQDGLSDPYSVYVQGRYAYVANQANSSLVIFDVSNPTAPVKVSSVTTGLSLPEDVYVQGQYAYVASNFNSTLVIFDVSNPAAPVRVGSITSSSRPNTVYVQGRYAYVTNSTSDTLNIFDVSNPASPTQVSSISTYLDDPEYVYVQGKYAYVASTLTSELVAYDISNPAYPVVAGRVNAGGTASSVYVQGRYAYVTTIGSGVLSIIDLGGSYISQLEAGGIETGTLSVRDNLFAVDGDFKGGVNVGQSLNVTGGLAISAASSTNNKALPIFTISPATSTDSIGATTTTSYLSVTGKGFFGLGTTTPASNFFLQNNYGNSTTTLFTIASSTSVGGNSYSNLFAIDRTGSTTVANGININGGCYALNGTCLTLSDTIGNWFAAGNTFGTTTAATTTSIWTQGAFFSSSTVAASQFPYASSTAFTVGNLFGTAASSTSLFANVFTASQGVFGATASSTFTSAGLLGIGSSTPFGALTVQATNGSVYPGNFVFNIASTTSLSDAPINLFSISNTGNVLIGQNLATTTLVASSTGQFSVLPGTTTLRQISSITTGGGPSGMYVQGRYTYVVYLSGLQIIDTTNPASPVILSTITTGLNNPKKVFVSGNYAYVSNYGGGTLAIFDVSNPSAPQFIGSTSDGLSGPYATYVQGKYAYVADFSNNYLVIFDISNPTLPVKVGATNSGLNTPYSISVQGKYAYITSTSNNALVTFDISNPAAPVRISSATTGFSIPASLYVQGRYAYIGDIGGAVNGLVIYDMSNPASPVKVSSLNTGISDPRGIFVQGRYAYMTSNGNSKFFVIDVSNPAVPVIVNSYSPPSNNPYVVHVQGRYAYVGGSTLTIYDLGGAYVSQLEAGGIETGSLMVRNGISAVDGTFTGGLNIGQSLNVTGGLSVSSASSTFSKALPIFTIAPGTTTNSVGATTSPFVSVTGNGFFGLGTSTPNTNFFMQNNYGNSTTTLFTIASSTSFNGNSYSSLFSIDRTGSTTAANGFNITSGCFAVNGACIGGSSPTGSTGQIAYFSGTNTAVGTSSVFLATNGNFGVGTTSPFAKVAIHANPGETNMRLFEIASSTASATSSLFVVTNAGNVGIGTSTPGSPLSVTGAAYITGNVQVDGDVNVANGKCFKVNGVCIGYVKTLAGIYATTTPGSNVQVTKSIAGLTFANGALTIPASTTEMIIEVVGGGGGGSGSGTGGGTGGSDGGNSSFGTGLATTTGNGGGNGTVSLNGGTGGTASGGDFNATGNVGNPIGGYNSASLISSGGAGGAGPWGGAGAGTNGTVTGGNGIAPGAGGGGAGFAGAAYPGAGGGAGGYAKKLYTSPSGTYYYNIGAGGSAGSATASGANGGAGAAGAVIITVYATSSANAAGNDYAEMFPVSSPRINAADIVAVDTGTPISMKLAEKGSTLAGVIATHPGQVLGDIGASGMRPVALMGRVPVKVNMEGGPIKIGDRIAVSSVPGVGKKAGVFDDSIGIAIDNFDLSATSTSDGTVMTFITLQDGMDINAIAFKLLGDDTYHSIASSTGTSTSSEPLDFVGGMMHAFTSRISGWNTLTYTASTSAATTTATTTEAIATDSIVDGFMQGIFSTIRGWFASAANGINKLFAKEINTDKLCVGQTCVTEDQLKVLLQNAAASAAPQSGGSASESKTPDTTSTSSSTVQTTPAETSTSTPVTSADTSSTTPQEDSTTIETAPASTETPPPAAQSPVTETPQETPPDTQS